MDTKKKMQIITVISIVVGVFLAISGLVVAISSGTHRVAATIIFGADYYTDSYRAMAAAANNVRLVGIAFGLTMLAAGVVIVLVYASKLMKLSEVNSCQPTLPKNVPENAPKTLPENSAENSPENSDNPM